MYDIKAIYRAGSVEDAVSALAADPEAVLIAGGTDVLIKVREGSLAGRRLISIHGLKTLAGVTFSPDNDVEIGPLTTFRGVTTSGIIKSAVPVLGEAADMAGGPQLRAQGTIGGNVCNGITSADTASTLLAFDAVLRAQGQGGVRDIPISQWYKGVGKVAIAHEEVLVKIIIPKNHYEGFSGHYIKYAQRSAMDIATLGVSCLVRLSENKKTVIELRLAFGVAAPVPVRAKNAETELRNVSVQEAVGRVGALALTDVDPRNSWRASRDFRLQLTRELSARALLEAARKGGADL